MKNFVFLDLTLFNISTAMKFTQAFLSNNLVPSVFIGDTSVHHKSLFFQHQNQLQLTDQTSHVNDQHLIN